MRAFFHVLDAEVALKGLAEGPFLSEQVGDILEEDMADISSRTGISKTLTNKPL